MIRYADSIAGISPGQLAGFFEGWPDPPSPETHLRILAGSAAVIIAIDDATERVVGFITAVADGALSAYIPLLEVLPEYRNGGIGAELVRRMLAALDGYYMIDLLCDAGLAPYYERFGMTRGTGMMIRNYSRQSGRG